MQLLGIYVNEPRQIYEFEKHGIQKGASARWQKGVMGPCNFFYPTRATREESNQTLKTTTGTDWVTSVTLFTVHGDK